MENRRSIRREGDGFVVIRGGAEVIVAVQGPDSVKVPGYVKADDEGYVQHCESTDIKLCGYLTALWQDRQGWWGRMTITSLERIQ